MFVQAFELSPTIQGWYRAVFSKTHQILKALFCRKTAFTCWKDRVIIMQTSLCFPPRETQAFFFFTLHIRWKIFSFVAESVRSCKPSNFNCIHPGLPLQDSSVWAVWEQSPEDWVGCHKGWHWSLGASGLQRLPISRGFQFCSVATTGNHSEHLCGLRLSVKEFWRG